MGGWDYWTYQNQPIWFLSEIRDLIEQENFESKRQEMKSKEFKNGQC